MALPVAATIGADARCRRIGPDVFLAQRQSRRISMLTLTVLVNVALHVGAVVSAALTV